MGMDPASLQRIKTFMEFLNRAKHEKLELSFVTTPTEHGDNITATAIICGERVNTGLLFWDVNLLQNHGLVDILDDEDLALGMNLTDGMVEDTEKILAFVEAEIKKLGNS